MKNPVTLSGADLGGEVVDWPEGATEHVFERNGLKFKYVLSSPTQATFAGMVP